MASVISGFEYDIFISYRQKDNKGDRWVSEFVEALKIELESTFKEEVTVYFDVNPHDGLLEIHDVDASLEGKLKCLVFIPVVSRTYCDPRSFAWEHEFKAFIKQSSSDQFGSKVILPNGNVINRILPVRIHDLDITDLKLLEDALSGPFRSVDFVYRTPGVNRPLRPVEEHPQDNINKTYYRDQINKIANFIKDIILTLKNNGISPAVVTPEMLEGFYKNEERKTSTVSKTGLNKNLLKILVIVVLFIASLAVVYLLRSTHFRNLEKTIAIIPLTNPPNNYDLGKYAIGSMDAIITKLQEIKSLTVRGRLSSLQYLDTKKTPGDLRKELNANYLIELSISGTPTKLQMFVGLTKTKTDKQLWAHQYDIDEEQLMPLFTNIVQTIASNLDIKFSQEEIINIEKNLTKNPEAYKNYLAASAKLFSAMGNKFLDSLEFRSAIKLYDKAIEEDPGFSIAYARRAIARSWGIYSNELDASNIEKCWSDINSALKINKELTDIQIALGFYYYYCKKDYINALISFNNATMKDPENYQPIFYMALVYRAMGEWDKMHLLINKVIRFNPQEPLYLTNIGLSFDYLHKFDSAYIYHQKAININPDFVPSYFNKMETCLYKYGNTAEARILLDSVISISHQKYEEYKILFDIYDGKYSEAFIETKKADPDDLGGKGAMYVYLGNIAKSINKTEDARRYFDSADIELNRELKTDKDNVDVHSLLSFANAGLGKVDKSVSEAKKAIDITVNSKNKMRESEMIVNLAQVYTILGLYDDAIYNIEYSLKNPSLFSTNILKLDPVWKPLLNQTKLKIIMEKYKN